jgi:hypothetical protein
MAGIEYSAKIEVTSPAWAKDYGDRNHLVPGGARIDASQFPRDDAVLVTVGTGGAAIGATTVPVTALSGPVPAGTHIYTNLGKQINVTVEAATGATSITVEPLGNAVVAGENGQYRGTGKVTVRDGTLIGRTYTERDAGTGFGPAADADDEMYFLYHTIDNALRRADATLYRHGSIVAENHVPGWAGLSTAKKAYVRSKYQTTRGAD